MIPCSHSRNNFLVGEKILLRDVSVSLSEGGWEAERGLRMENGQNSCDKGGGQEAERGLRLCV